MKIQIVMPAYNAAKTLERTINDIDPTLGAKILLVDDSSTDETLEIAKSLGIKTIRHLTNKGYGANQKTCYKEALRSDADIIAMVHPDYQYDSRVVGIMAKLIELEICDVVLGNRIRTRKEAFDGGMPKWKYFINRISTFIENFLLGQTLGDFHSGLRVYSRKVLETIPFELNSNSFAFDQQFLVQAVHFGFKIGDVPVPVRYFSEASSINFRKSLIYGFGGLYVILKYFLHRFHLIKDTKFVKNNAGVVQG